MAISRRGDYRLARLAIDTLSTKVTEILNQNNCKGIKSDCQDEKQRLYYWLDVTPVFDVQQVARTIADHLCQEHGLTVRLIVDRCPEQVVKLE